MALGRKRSNKDLPPGIPRQGSAPAPQEAAEVASAAPRSNSTNSSTRFHPVHPEPGLESELERVRPYVEQDLDVSANAAVELDQLVRTLDPAAVTPEPVHPAQAWPGLHLLVEHPHRWEQEPLAGLDEPISGLLRRFELQHEACATLIRRPRDEAGGGIATDGDRRVFLSTPAHDGLVVSRSLGELAELTDIDLAAAVRDVQCCRVPAGWQEAEPVTLVTAHASSAHRISGPTLASALLAVDPENVWETALAIGPDNSVNTISLPGNHVHVNLRPRLVNQLLDATWQERLVLEQFAGRSHHTPAQRLAEITLRGRLGADACAAITAVSVEEASIAIGERDDSPASVSRLLTRWRVYPALIGDPALVRMTPARASQPTQTWRVVIDRSQLVEAEATDEHLSVIEVADEDEPGRGAHAWDTAYGSIEHDLLPDPTVVAEVAPLSPGRALDLGCGSGRNTLWLAEQGWQVTGVDFSRSGLWRMADEAGRRGLTVRAELADLRVWTPAAADYDLILVSHVHVEDIFRRTAPWLSATGRVVVIGPAEGADEDGLPRQDYVLMAARATGARLRVLRAGEVERRNGQRVARDAVVVAARPS